MITLFGNPSAVMNSRIPRSLESKEPISVSADPQIAITCRTQGIAQSADHVAHRAPAFYIPRSEIANFDLTPVVIVPELNAGAVVEWNEKSTDCRCPLKAALG